MSITQNDFKKIWASTSSVPEYTFSDADYQNGWEFVGELPPTRAMWDTLQRRNDQKMKYLQDNGSMCFDSVADMVATDIDAGQTVLTKGYHSVNDGGSALYTIRAKDVADVDDGGSIIFLANGKVAELITDGTVCPEQFGAYGDGTHDDTTAIQNAITFSDSVYIPVGTYIVSAPIDASGRIFGEGEFKNKGNALIDCLFNVVDDVEFDGVTFNAYHEQTQTSDDNLHDTPIYVYNKTCDINVHNCKFLNIYGSYIWLNLFYGKLDITNNLFDTTSATRYSSSVIHMVTCSTTTADYNINNNVFVGTGDRTDNAGGLLMAGCSARVINIRDNVFNKIGRNNTVNHRICCLDVYSKTDNLRIIHNQFINYSWSPIRIHGTNDCVIDGNYIGEPVDYINEWTLLISSADSSGGEEPVKNVTISNNVFYAPTNRVYFGIQINGEANKISDVSILNNSFTMTGSVFVYVDTDVTNFKIIGNTADRNINFYDGDFTTDVYIQDNTLGAKIELTGGTNTGRFIITNNTITGSGSWGIEGISTNKNIYAVGNKIIGSRGINQCDTAINNVMTVINTPGIANTTTALDNYVNGAKV